MAVDVAIPSLGLTMEEGTIVEWLKSPGDVIVKDEPLFSLQTDKAMVDVGAPASGILATILVSPGETVPIGRVVATIAEDGDPKIDVAGEGLDAKDTAPAHPHVAADLAAPEVGEESSPASSWAGGLKSLRSSPAARRTAQELGVELGDIVGTGPQGRITRQDVLKKFGSASPTPQPPDVRPLETKLEPLSRIRRMTVERMVHAWNTIPMVTLFAEVNMDAAVPMFNHVKALLQERDRLRLKWDVLWIKAVALALKAHPLINAQWKDGEVKVVPDINVGFAVATEQGLVVPVVRAAQQWSLEAIAKTVDRLSAKAREGRLGMDDLSDATFTISNLGGFGMKAFTPIVNPPQAAILGVGTIGPGIRMIDGNITPAQTLMLSLTFDHRVFDGAPAAIFLRSIKQYVEEPYRLLLTD